MTEPIALSSSPINAKTQKAQKRQKGKAKAGSSTGNTAIIDPTPAAAAAAHTASQGTPTPGKGSGRPLGTVASSSDHDDDIIDLGEYGDFDYDAVKADDGVELWLVRAPRTMKTKSLRDLEIHSSRVGGPVGDLTRKGTVYDVWALDPVSSGGGRNADGSGGMVSSSAAQVAGVGAEELNGLSVLLPCKQKGGSLYLAQKPITQHLVISARPAKPTRPEVAFEAPKREAYPDEVLKHRFRPYGDPGDLPSEDHMDVDVVEVSPKEKEKFKRKGGAEKGSSKKRKTRLVVP